MFFFLPLGTTRPRWRTPYLTYAIILANMAVFAYQLYQPDALPPGYVPAHPSLAAWFLAMFIHAGFMHLAMNMVFFWLFATLTEDIFGPWLMLGVYVAGNIGATLGHSLMGVLFAPASLGVPVVGASGAIAGIMGLSAVCFLRTRVRVWYLIWWLIIYFKMGVIEIAAPVFLGLWVGWEAVQGLLSTAVQSSGGVSGAGVAHWAHVGGFLVGMGLAIGLKLRQRVVRTDLTEEERPPEGAYEAYAYAAELERATRESPEDPEGWYALARARELSGKTEMAAPAYLRALGLYSRQHKEDEAVRSYLGLKKSGSIASIPADLRFPLACALEERDHKEDAFRLFWDVGHEGGQSQQGETALIRAGEIARALPGYEQQARECYRKLLTDYAYGPWRSLAMERLQELGAAGMEPAATSETQPDGAPADSGLRSLDETGR